MKITVCYNPLPSDHNQKIREKINDKIKKLIDRRKKNVKIGKDDKYDSD